MSEKIKKAKESLEKLIEDISIDSGYSYPALYADIRIALDDFDKYHESQQDLIKGKDEYIAKLCNDRAELKEHEKDLIAEQHRLFDLAKEQENELNELREFAKSIFKYCLNYQELLVNMLWGNDSDKERYNRFVRNHIEEKAEDMTFNEWKTIKKVVEKYGKS